jgi:5'-3' exoribonuclease 2
MPNPGNTPNLQNQAGQNTGLLSSPPTNWINKTAAGNTGMYFKQESTSIRPNEKQVKQVYQVKTRVAQETPDIQAQETPDLKQQ